MKQELEDKLVEKYPKLFRDINADMTKTCMCWGFECGDGWYWLIDNLCDNIQGYINANNKKQVIVSQVKEKFGGLRFYVDGGDKLIDGMIWLAEGLSMEICEMCGSTEDVTCEGRGWITTKCTKCRNK